MRSTRCWTRYAGRRRAPLEQSVREPGEEQFGRYLKESNSAMKGIAIPDFQALSDRETGLGCA